MQMSGTVWLIFQYITYYIYLNEDYEKLLLAVAGAMTQLLVATIRAPYRHRRALGYVAAGIADRQGS